MGTKVESILKGTVDKELREAQTAPKGATVEAEYTGNRGGTKGDGSTGQKTTTLKLQSAHGLDKSVQPTQPSKDLGRSTGYD